MLEQFTWEWLELYAQSRLPAAGSEDIKTSGTSQSVRRRFVARAAANDWDGIIITQTAFKSIGVRPKSASSGFWVWNFCPVLNFSEFLGPGHDRGPALAPGRRRSRASGGLSHDGGTVAAVSAGGRQLL